MIGSLSYKILYGLFYQEKHFTPLNNVDKAMTVLLSTQLLLQNLRLLWNSKIPIHLWESYLPFWNAIAYPCIDSLAATLNSMFIFLVVVLCGLTIIVLLIVLHVFFSILGKVTPMFLIKIQKFLIFLICDTFFIPCTTVLVIFFKYSTVNMSYMEEYSNSPSSGSFQLGITGQVLSSIFLALILSISIINECCKSEIRHSLTEKSLHAKSFYYLGAYIKIVYFIQCLSFCSIQINFYFYYLVSVLIGYFSIVYLYIYRLPYYSNFMNLIKVTLHFEVFCVIVFLIVGYSNNNATVVIVLTVFMQPFIVIASKLVIDYRISKIKILKKEIKSSFNQFEISARNRLLSPENSDELMKYINKNYSITKNELLFVIQAYYCADILKNSALGSIKLSKVNTKSLNFFSGFQVYKCYKILEEINIKASEGFKLCLYLLNIDKILTQEKKLCKNLQRLWNKVLDPKYDLDSLTKFLNKSAFLIKDIQIKYLENLANHLHLKK
jgi:hypothetical protein